MKTKKNPRNLLNINQPLNEFRKIPVPFISAIVMTFFAMSAMAGNVLVNPGFETSTLSGWTQHTLETWSSGPASSVNGREGNGTPINIKLVHTGNDALWMQGTYGNGGGTMPDESISQTIACFPGNAYTADAWYSAYLFCTNHIGGDDGQLAPLYGLTPPYSATQGGGSGLFEGGTEPGNAGAGAGAQQDGWVEVRFLDSSQNVLADYKSTILDPAYEGYATDNGLTSATGLSYSGTLPVVTNAIGNVFLAWADFPVTNQYDISKAQPNTDPDTEIANGAITNTLNNGRMVAPAGAAHVEFSVHIYQPGNVGYAAAPFWDDCTLNQVAGPSPSVITPTPNGLSFFTGATNFTFNVASASTGGAPLPTNSTSNVGVIVNGQNETGSLQFSGTSTSLTATLQGLTSNSVYTIAISVTNSVGLISAQTVTFDTFPTNPFVVSAEDYDYTNGQFFQNPIPTAAPAANSYFGTAGTIGVDLSGAPGGGTGGGTELIRTDGGASMQIAQDIQLPIYAGQDNPNIVNVQIAYNDPGDWFNYTRNYPAGNYLAFLRYNNPTAGNIESLNMLTSGYGTSSQTVTNLGVFIGANTGAGYAWTPLTDPYGNKIILNLPAAENSPSGNNTTLQLRSGNGAGAGGIANFVDFILVPAGSEFPPVIDNLNPNNINPPVNANIFLDVTDITYSVSSTFSTIASANIHTVINGVDVSSSATYVGSDTDWSVSLPCPQNQLINLLITATDASGNSNRVTEVFDTFTQSNYMVEALDYDFNGGQFIDNPIPTAGLYTATNSYYDGGLFTTNMAVSNVDYYGFADIAPGGAELFNYRPLDLGSGQEITTDFQRYKFVASGAQDYDEGYWNGGFWENYTRTFPADSYHVYSRMAGGNGPFANTTLSLVTSGRGQISQNQTTKLLGSFADPNAAGWTTWHWVPMLGANGNLATISLGGVQTLRLTSGNNLNVHYLMFVPSEAAPMTASRSGSSISLSFPTMAGYSYTVLYNSTLIGGTWQPLSATISGDGTVKTVNDTVVGQTRFYKLQIQVQY